MITKYLRPNSIEEAIRLIKRTELKTYPLSGGSVLSHYQGEPISVVDLQDLNLNEIKFNSDIYSIGATSTLTQIEEEVDIPELKEAIRLQAGKNKRNTGTLAGLIHMADGRSALLTVLLAMDMNITWQPGNIQIPLGEWIPVRTQWKNASLITEFSLPKVKIVYDYVSRTPKDLPILLIAIAKWNSGRIRVSIGGFGPNPMIVFDGKNFTGIEEKIDQLLVNSEDEWASAAYRREIGKAIFTRLIALVEG